MNSFDMMDWNDMKDWKGFSRELNVNNKQEDVEISVYLNKEPDEILTL